MGSKIPEGPEVRKISDQLSKFVGWQITPVALGGRYANEEPEGFFDFAIDCKTLRIEIKSVKSKGKFLYWELSNDWTIWNTLGMSGSWASKPEKHEALKFDLYKEQKQTVLTSSSLPSLAFYDRPALAYETISFVDPRRFGTVKFVNDKDKLATKLATLGWDHLVREYSTTVIWWYLKDARKTLQSKPISIVLMDQSIFAGVGNYLRAEILYASKISPHRLLENITYDELDIIIKNTRRIMLNSYESGGATISTYRDVEGNKGEFSSKFDVYGRKTDVLGNKVIKEKTSDGRTIHWVKEVQV